MKLWETQIFESGNYLVIDEIFLNDTIFLPLKTKHKQILDKNARIDNKEIIKSIKYDEV
jgi:hypothetical protein